MSIPAIEAAIVKLPFGEIDKLMAWLSDRYARIWDNRSPTISTPAALHDLFGEVDREIEAGTATPL